jgi:alkylation response protein AidB-like acyl-CoA dehydrogenase
MNPSYFTEEHQLFRESLKDFLQKKLYRTSKREKREQLNASYGKSLEMGFGKLSEVYGLNLDLFYTVIFLEELQRLNHLVAAYVGTFLFSHDT